MSETDSFALKQDEPETPEQMETRRSALLEAVCNFLGEQGYELDSLDETAELLGWLIDADRPPAEESGRELAAALARVASLAAERIARLNVLDEWVDELHAARAERDAALATMKQAARVEDNHRDKDFMWIVGQMRGILEASPLWKANK
ncbi:hypothetical protein ASC66_01095 [Leifsonia sp. Root4]|uniref:hypothetical protein n=1 Tax=Leifsonia sp. Root4 TaxID=1736525 RepID=UPI0006FB0FFB|nr:hypothetical protein [Leifsonia sp. Root4]KQW07625.1 hypothetical protein ASC66_01095 [Leifsonia sp. Root4]